ncbi:DUF1489 family protein [Sphingomonas flavalba]|uniref:DUF1489 family protein n=1 Tax=Sphingomonas flavalba TaxID=2559804 RepID=UPI00109E19B5|nr:DUF1489 domain-containing protein [Sphingomonas flavalba]
MAALHITKVAVGCSGFEALAGRIAARATGGTVDVTTRYRPTRHAGLIGGSLYWIIKHHLVARQTIVDFVPVADAPRWIIRLESALVPVQAWPRRAHQGWRYLNDPDAPPDLAHAAGGDALPAAIRDELAALALL